LAKLVEDVAGGEGAVAPTGAVCEAAVELGGVKAVRRAAVSAWIAETRDTASVMVMGYSYDRRHHPRP
jgi:hypothetical protein